MIWAYGFLNERLVCLCATPARLVTSSNHRSLTDDAPPPRQATATSSAAAPVFRILSAGVFFLHERIGTLGHLYDPVCGHVLKSLRHSRTRPLHNHFVHRGRIAQPEILAKRILRPIPVSQYHFAHLRLSL